MLADRAATDDLEFLDQAAPTTRPPTTASEARSALAAADRELVLLVADRASRTRAGDDVKREPHG